ncbi:hypothetical protein H8E88_21665 [candidate division KSB1 bacterium]|nr:hypothetical protein [candidate division KSB1 bacterium]MBL7093507.1 hypothetical protein [candidate division KSB1 bacterium]
MEIQLTGKVAEIVNSKVASGGYQNADAFISDIVLRADEFDRLKLDLLRNEVNIGLNEIKRGEIVEFDLDNFFNEETK